MGLREALKVYIGFANPFGLINEEIMVRELYSPRGGQGPRRGPRGAHHFSLLKPTFGSSK